MKTSLIIEDSVFKDAKKEADRSGSTISDVISAWARLGRDAYREHQKDKKRLFKAADLGEQLVDLSNRRKWMEELE